MGNSASSTYPGNRDQRPIHTHPTTSLTPHLDNSSPPARLPPQRPPQQVGSNSTTPSRPNTGQHTGPVPSATPGAFSVDGTGGPNSVFRVEIPAGVRPGQEFQVYAGSRLVRVRCPASVRPGQSLQITIPPEPTVNRVPRQAPLTTLDDGGPPVEMPLHMRQNNGVSPEPDIPLPDSEPSINSPGVERIPSSGSQPTYMVTVPSGVVRGMQFPVVINGQRLMVTCPNDAAEGMRVRIIVPSTGTPSRPPDTPAPAPIPTPAPAPAPAPRSTTQTQMFEVVVPQGARPGQPFALLAGGQRVLVTCPPSAYPGQRIRFQLPIALTQGGSNSNQTSSRLASDVKLSYDKDGWTRTIRVTDMKFQWVRMDDKGDVDLSHRFDPKTAAYVRKIHFVEGNDPRMRSGRITLVPASKAAVESSIMGPNGKEIVTFGDIASAQRMPYEEKSQWFQDTCKNLRVEWNEGHMRMIVRRDYLLNDSMAAVMSLSRKDLKKVWRFEFIGEMGIDAGGLTREWFQLVTEEIFNPDNGLWQSSATNQMSMQINPSSDVACPEDHLVYFRFLGRVIGKALFDQQLVAGHMVRHLYKHMLGWPVMFDDLELIDEEYYQNLKKMLQYSEDELEMLCLDFTSTHSNMGAVEVVELIEGGKDIEVTKDNLPEYMECCLKYRMMGRVRLQLTELLLGFFDIIPEPLLTVFDFQELELLMCGLPNIDMDDWKNNTLYTGEYDGTFGRSNPCTWFWEVVEDHFDNELRARLLQFVTGTSGVPSRGFSVLQGNDGNIRKFTIHGVRLETCLYPRAHTCFNRIDLPLYKTKKDLLEKLKLAVQMEATGFGIE